MMNLDVAAAKTLALGGGKIKITYCVSYSMVLLTRVNCFAISLNDMCDPLPTAAFLKAFVGYY
jgi:hypothetical protein